MYIELYELQITEENKLNSYYINKVFGILIACIYYSWRIFFTSSRHEMGMGRAFDRSNGTASGTSSIDIGEPFMVFRGPESSNTSANSSSSFAFRVWAVSGVADATMEEGDGVR